MKFHIEGNKHFLGIGKDKRSGEIKYTFYKVEDGPRERSKPNFEELIARAGTNTDLPTFSQANKKPTTTRVCYLTNPTQPNREKTIQTAPPPEREKEGGPEEPAGSMSRAACRPRPRAARARQARCGGLAGARAN